MIQLSCAFDSGAITVLSCNDPADMRIALRPDNAAHFKQWFHFRASGVKGVHCAYTLIDAGEAAYPGGWDGYAVRASYDRRHWFCVPTQHEAGQLHFNHVPDHDTVYYAYFEPYGWERHLDLIARAQSTAPWCHAIRLGQTLEGRDLDLLRIGEPDPGKRNIWVIARQHPGESMAEWFAEGLIDALLDAAHAPTRALLQTAVFHIVPNMNPDGSVRGNLRTNAAGANLNREWATPSATRSPEVLLVRQKMREVGVDAFLDVHGDETIPHNFVAGCEGNPSFSTRQCRLQDAFKGAWLAASPDFQTDHGYQDREFGPEQMTLATNWVGDAFDCLAFTIEMPFKDTAGHPSPATGWNGERSRQLGASVLLPLLAVCGQLR
ncbi:M14-type cytosolic carboxypeptidase [Chitiniphilus purpureus]|uniref:M14-type cytosolic carboxypeptidase n=1 Tax=Chitiniphilus purpureus TaxID=2981137 RepID=A0ABY6DSH2_9NEIS|nr:M14-type cytosolic carboxypeptidase [Chitiniphilus sp. CD1]UXY16026.1 M14-type cytosolic carboxypeptidase [Chitiniphilus sp. CD1]